MPPSSRTIVETNGQVGHLLDVSPLGARVETRGSIRPNEELRLAWRKNGRLVETTGVVVWSQANLAGNQLSYRAGNEFLEPVSLRDTGFVGEDFGLPA